MYVTVYHVHTTLYRVLCTCIELLRFLASDTFNHMDLKSVIVGSNPLCTVMAVLEFTRASPGINVAVKSTQTVTSVSLYSE